MSAVEDWRRASLWAQALEEAPAGRALEDTSADVVVVGAGITGLLVATLLARGGADVLVLDRHGLGGVATRNTTAKVSALQGTTYSSITKSRGAEVARWYAAAQLDAVAGVARLVGELGVECHLTEAPAYTYAEAASAVDTASAELAAAADAGLDVHWVAETDLPFEVPGAVRLDGQLHMHPGLLCLGLAERLGADRLAGSATVVDVDEGGDGVEVRLDNGVRVAAGHVVVATQGPIVDPQLLANRCAPMQSYCLAARIDGEVPAGMYLSADEDSRSVRPARDADGEPLLVVGGAGHHMGEEVESPASRWDVLAEWTERRFGPARVTHRWATHDLVPTDHVPFVGPLGTGPGRRWVATGFAKWGMTNAYVAARILAAAIGGGEPPPWAGAFDSTRLLSTVNRELASAGATATRHLVGDRLARRSEPRCTHQGCVLRLDDALGTWDCPCHGSRFDADGSVVQGPAVARLDLPGG